MSRWTRIGGLFVGVMVLATVVANASVHTQPAPVEAVTIADAPQPHYTTRCEACGGANGVPFDRVHVHRASAQIILLAPPGSGLHALNDDGKLSIALERAGFAVQVVESEQALDLALNDNAVDVVLADGADATPLRDRLAGSSAGPLVLSVGADVRAVEAPAGGQCRVQAPTRNSRHFVKQVESFVSARQSGTALACNTPG